MKIIYGILTKFALGQYGYPPRPAPYVPVSVGNGQEVHQGNLCGEVIDYVIGKKPQLLTSPYYPKEFRSQTQCQWTVQTADPSARIKVTFDDFIIPTSGKDCYASYIQFEDGAGLLDPTSGIKANTNSVKVCGKNPGFIVSQTSSLLVMLHADDVLSQTQRFRLSLSATHERPRLLGLNGHAVKDGKPSEEVGPQRPQVYKQRPQQRPHQNSRPISPRKSILPMNPSSANTAVFQGANYGKAPTPQNRQFDGNFPAPGIPFGGVPRANMGIPPSSRSSYMDTDYNQFNTNEAIDVYHKKKGMSKRALILIYIFIVISLIASAIGIRKLLKKKKEDEKVDESKMAEKK